MFSSLLLSVSNFATGTPASIHCLLQFDGEWDANGVFSYTHAYEIDIPIHAPYQALLEMIPYQALLEMIRNTVPSSYGNSVFIISYMSNSCASHVAINDDASLHAYLRLKSTYPSLRDFPLCVELCDFAERSVSNGGSVLGEVPQIFLGYHSNLNSDAQEETKSDASVRHALQHETMRTNGDLQEINSLKEMRVTSRFDPTRIAVDAIYASKMDLDFHLKMLAISNCFQYRTRTSKKSELHVVCVDFPRCKWAVRAVRLLGVDMFQIRRYNRDHQCPIDVRQGTTRQATYHIVAELVKHNFCDATIKPYPPNSIVTDMRREHGIAMTYKKAWAASEVECDRFLRYLSSDDPRIIGYLKAIGKEKWARSCSNNRFSIMTSNLAESMNNVDVIPREYPISQLVDFLVGRMQVWFHKRRELANSTSSILTKFYEAELKELHAASTVMEVRPACAFEFLVFDKNGRSFVVNFQNRSCTCCEFQLDHFVCVHAVAATRSRKGLSCYDYISSFYTAASWRAIYSGIIHPIPSKDSWVVPDDVTHTICLPPSCSKRPPGRPKKRRIPSKGEHGKRQTCSRCKSSGHNRKTCSNPIALSRA
ncbi:unnamed protein product [Cuscuta campestris]|uniref:SWIM-type domain-containing protein n=1 Tax=Cuscuta campestris TaxID=132261 RepID=A0A484M2B2_9ASTE|nr:unnamed protein product [Cuscuta campestris]